MSELATLESKQDQDVNAKELTLYTGREYFRAIANDIAQTQAGDRVAITTMCFEPADPLVSDVMTELYAAADRKVDIVFGTDAYSFLIDYDNKSVGPLFLPQPLRQSTFKRRLAALEELAKKPTATYGIINKPEYLLSNPYAGRSHIKTTVVNDKVYLGGPNFHKTNRLDMVVGLEDSETADWLYDITRRIAETESTATVLGDQDQSRQIDDTTRILIDAGKLNQSLILDEALKIMDEAKEYLWATFQFFPDGEPAHHLVVAHNRGIDVHPVYNHPHQNGLLVGAMQRLAVAKQRHHMPAHFFEGQMPRSAPTLHSKAITSEQSAMVGSHNYVEAGVKLGTPEIALIRNDPEFARQVGELILSQVRSARTDVPVILR